MELIYKSLMKSFKVSPKLLDKIITDASNLEMIHSLRLSKLVTSQRDSYFLTSM